MKIFQPRSDIKHVTSALICLIFVSAGTTGRCAAVGDPKAAQFEKVVSHYEQCGYLRGVVVVAQSNHIIYARGVGEANQLSHIPNTVQTKFGIASITKQFTAALVLQQVAQGRIRLDGSICDYLPWYRKDTGTRMTVDQLLHHTSGLPADYNDPEFCDSREAQQHYIPEEFARKFCQPELATEPGTKWAYSNCGYVLLGLILEKATGKHFGDLLTEQLLVPLGMNNTGMDRNNLEQLGGASGYTRHAGPRYTPGPYLDRSHIFSAGAMYSSAEDLLTWNKALSSTNCFPEKVRRAMFEPGLGNWADGWFVTRIPAGTPGADNILQEMRGDMPGNFFTWILRYPQQDAVIIVLRNGYGSTEHLEDNLQAILFNQPTHLPNRSPKDLLANAFRAAMSWPLRHPIQLGLLLSGLTLAIFLGRARHRNAGEIAAQLSPSKV